MDACVNLRIGSVNSDPIFFYQYPHDTTLQFFFFLKYMFLTFTVQQVWILNLAIFKRKKKKT